MNNVALLHLHDEDGDVVMIRWDHITGLEVLLDDSTAPRELATAIGTYITTLGGHIYEVTESPEYVLSQMVVAARGGK